MDFRFSFFGRTRTKFKGQLLPRNRENNPLLISFPLWSRLSMFQILTGKLTVIYFLPFTWKIMQFIQFQMIVQSRCRVHRYETRGSGSTKLGTAWGSTWECNFLGIALNLVCTSWGGIWTREMELRNVWIAPWLVMLAGVQPLGRRGVLKSVIHVR